MELIVLSCSGGNLLQKAIKAIGFWLLYHFKAFYVTTDDGLCAVCFHYHSKKDFVPIYN